MALRRGFVGLALVSVVVIGICLLSLVPQAIAETLSSKALVKVTKMEGVPIADVEGHVVGVQVREGVAVFGNGDWAWVKAIATGDFVKGVGPFDQYTTFTLLDGSTFTAHTKGMTEATPQGVSSKAKWSGDIVNGTGRFQGIKGTVTVSGTSLPLEKGELAPKTLVEATFVYTLPGK